jgi:hypothetical protein
MSAEFWMGFGLFMGNWLITPLFIKDRTFFDGFMIGVIAWILFAIFWFFVPISP